MKKKYSHFRKHNRKTPPRLSPRPSRLPPASVAPPRLHLHPDGDDDAVIPRPAFPRDPDQPRRRRRRRPRARDNTAPPPQPPPAPPPPGHVRLLGDDRGRLRRVLHDVPHPVARQHDRVRAVPRRSTGLETCGSATRNAVPGARLRSASPSARVVRIPPTRTVPGATAIPWSRSSLSRSRALVSTTCASVRNRAVSARRPATSTPTRPSATRQSPTLAACANASPVAGHRHTNTAAAAHPSTSLAIAASASRKAPRSASNAPLFARASARGVRPPRRFATSDGKSAAARSARPPPAWPSKTQNSATSRKPRRGHSTTARSSVGRDERPGLMHAPDVTDASGESDK